MRNIKNTEVNMVNIMVNHVATVVNNGRSCLFDIFVVSLKIGFILTIKVVLINIAKKSIHVRLNI